MDYHVLTMAVGRESLIIAVHLNAPTGNNDAQKLWRNVLRFGRNARTVVPSLERKFKAELEALNRFQIIEVVKTVEFSAPDITKAQRVNEIKKVVRQMKADIADPESDLYKAQLGIYDYYGHEGNVIAVS